MMTATAMAMNPRPRSPKSLELYALPPPPMNEDSHEKHVLDYHCSGGRETLLIIPKVRQQAEKQRCCFSAPLPFPHLPPRHRSDPWTSFPHMIKRFTHTHAL